jgi:hypothetical protein
VEVKHIAPTLPVVEENKGVSNAEMVFDFFSGSHGAHLSWLSISGPRCGLYLENTILSFSWPNAIRRPLCCGNVGAIATF